MGDDPVQTEIPVRETTVTVPPRAGGRSRARLFGAARLHVVSVGPPPGVPEWARVLVLHGYGEHSGRHLHFLRWMARRGVDSWAFDFHNHGLSGGRLRGHADGGWDGYDQDLDAVLGHLPRDGAPLFLLGQSHGGLVLARAGAGQRPLPGGVAGCVLVSPYLRSSVPVSRSQERLARLAGRAAPWLRVPTRFEPAWLTSDPEMRAEDAACTLCLRFATPGWYLAAREAQKAALAGAASFALPLLVVAGEDDPVSDPQAAREFFERAGSADKCFHSFAGMVHEPLRERERERVFALVHDWMRKRA